MALFAALLLVLLLCPVDSAAADVTWEHDTEYLYSYVSDVVLSSHTSEDEESAGPISPQLVPIRVMAMVSIFRVDADHGDADEGDADDDDDDGVDGAVLDLRVGTLRLQRPVGARHSLARYVTFQERQMPGRFRFVQRVDGHITRVSYDETESDDDADEESSTPFDVVRLKKGIVRAFSTLLSADDTSTTTSRSRMQPVSAGVRRAHHYHSRITRSHAIVTQTRDPLFSERTMRDSFRQETRVSLRTGTIEAVSIEEAVRQFPPSSDDGDSWQRLRAQHRSHYATHEDNNMDKEHSKENVDGNVRAQGSTRLTFVLSRPKKKEERQNSARSHRRNVAPPSPLTHDTLALRRQGGSPWAPIPVEQSQFNGEHVVAPIVWMDEFDRTQACYAAAQTSTEKTHCWKQMTIAVDHLGDDDVRLLFKSLRRHSLTASFLWFLDALAAAPSKRLLASQLLAQLLTGAQTLCRGDAHRVLTHGLFTAAQFAEPDVELAASLRNLTLLDPISAETLSSCSQEHMETIRHIATLAYGALGSRAPDSGLHQRVQADLVEALQQQNSRRRQLRDSGVSDAVTLIHALGNTGRRISNINTDAAAGSGGAAESALLSHLQHSHTHVRAAAVYSLRRHRSRTSAEYISRVAREDHHWFVRDAAVRAYTHRHSREIMDGSKMDALERLHASSNLTAAHRLLHRSRRNVVSNAVSTLESLAFEKHLQLSKPINFVKRVGTSNIGLFMTALADNSLDLFLSPLKSSISVNIDNQFVATSAIMGDSLTIVKAQLSLVGSLGYNVNMRLLEQLAERKKS